MYSDARREVFLLQGRHMVFSTIRDFYSVTVMLKAFIMMSPSFDRMKKVLMSLSTSFDEVLCYDSFERDFKPEGYSEFLQGSVSYLDEFHAVMDPKDFFFNLGMFSNFFDKCFPRSTEVLK